MGNTVPAPLPVQTAHSVRDAHSGEMPEKNHAKTHKSYLPRNTLDREPDSGEGIFIFRMGNLARVRRQSGYARKCFFLPAERRTA